MIEIEVDDFDLDQIFECGQAFRWKKDENGFWNGIVDGKYMRAKQNGNQLSLDCSMDDFKEFWQHYFDLERDYGEIKRTLSKNSPEMNDALAFGSGIRLLNQAPFEMLITFILSANNNIPRISSLVEKLSSTYGKGIYSNDALAGDAVLVGYSFPTPEVLAEADLEELRSLGVGYRDKYIKNSAAVFISRKKEFENLSGMDYEEAKGLLMTCPGVGSKVADCILLFSSGHHGAFPVDTWIKKVLQRRYEIDSTKDKVVLSFVDERFGSLKGFAQQYLFFYEREKG